MVWRRIPLLAALASCWGCAGTGVSPILHPGPASYQQAQAQKFDPFPLSDTGPDMAARPLAYIQTQTQAQRSQDSLTFQERFGQLPPPGLYKEPGGRQLQQIPYVPPQGALPPPGVLPPPPAASPFNAPGVPPFNPAPVQMAPQ
jgi:hypothetical protein